MGPPSRPPDNGWAPTFAWSFSRARGMHFIATHDRFSMSTTQREKRGRTPPSSSRTPWEGTAVNCPDPPTIDTDVLIIGAGPSGLFASYYAGLRGLSVVLLDSLAEPGGQLMPLYPDKPIYDVAGLPEVTGSALVTSLITQAELARPTWILGEQSAELIPAREYS